MTRARVTDVVTRAVSGRQRGAGIGGEESEGLAEARISHLPFRTWA